MKGKKGFESGKSGNPKGKPKGALNRINKDLRFSITQFLESNFDEVVSEWNKLDGKDKLSFYKDLLKYSVPTLQSTELKTDFDRMSETELDYIIENLKKNIA